MGILDQIAETRAERRSRLQQEETATTKTTDGSPAGGVSNQKNSAGWRIIGCVAILFGGLILTVSGIGQIGLSSDATYQLTHVALRLGFVVTVIGVFFGRRWINLKTALITTAILSVGIVLFVFWTVNQLSVHAVSHEEPNPLLVPPEHAETPLINMIQAEDSALTAEVTNHPNPYVGIQVEIQGHLARRNNSSSNPEWDNINIHCFKKERECDVAHTYLSAFGDTKLNLSSFSMPYRLRSWSDTEIAANVAGNDLVIQLGELIAAAGSAPGPYQYSTTYKAKAFLDREEVLGGDWFIRQNAK